MGEPCIYINPSKQKRKKIQIDVVETLYDLLYDMPNRSDILDILLTLYYSDINYPIDEFINIIEEGLSFMGRPINDITNHEYQYYLRKAYRSDCPIIPVIPNQIGVNYELFNDWKERQQLIATMEGLDFDYKNGNYKIGD